MLKVEEIMTKSIVYVKPDTPIYKAMELLVEYNISGIPVVEDDMTLVAIVSEKDILRLFADPGGLGNKTVYDFMTQPVIFFEKHEKIEDLCECLANNDFRRVPVTSHGALVGIVSRRDIIRSMLQEESVMAMSIGN